MQVRNRMLTSAAKDWDLAFFSVALANMRFQADRALVFDALG